MSNAQPKEKNKAAISVKFDIDFKVPRIGFDIKNLFNAKAIAIGVVAAAGILTVTGGALLIDALAHMNSGGGNAGLIGGAGVIAAGITGIWNAHAIGGQTAYKNGGLTALRNMFFMASTSVAPGALVAWGTSAALSPFISPVAGFAVGAIAGAAVNAKMLNWRKDMASPIVK